MIHDAQPPPLSPLTWDIQELSLGLCCISVCLLGDCGCFASWGVSACYSETHPASHSCSCIDISGNINVFHPKRLNCSSRLHLSLNSRSTQQPALRFLGKVLAGNASCVEGPRNPHHTSASSAFLGSETIFQRSFPSLTTSCHLSAALFFHPHPALIPSLSPFIPFFPFCSASLLVPPVGHMSSPAWQLSSPWIMRTGKKKASW